MDMRILGDTIRAARMRKGYTQDKLSEMLGITPLLLQMMKILDFSVDALVFTDHAHKKTLHTDYLTDQQFESLSRFLDTLKKE